MLKRAIRRYLGLEELYLLSEDLKEPISGQAEVSVTPVPLVSVKEDSNPAAGLVKKGYEPK